MGGGDDDEDGAGGGEEEASVGGSDDAEGAGGDDDDRRGEQEEPRAEEPSEEEEPSARGDGRTCRTASTVARTFIHLKGCLRFRSTAHKQEPLPAPKKTTCSTPAPAPKYYFPVLHQISTSRARRSCPLARALSH